MTVKRFPDPDTKRTAVLHPPRRPKESAVVSSETQQRGNSPLKLKARHTSQRTFIAPRRRVGMELGFVLGQNETHAVALSPHRRLHDDDEDEPTLVWSRKREK